VPIAPVSRSERDDRADVASEWLPVVGRALAVLALHAQELTEASIGRKAAFLDVMGLAREEIARVLGTTPETVRVELSQLRRKSASSKSKKGIR
jgi:CRP-like cAMP-binding protein